MDLGIFASRAFTWGTIAFAVTTAAMSGVLFVGFGLLAVTALLAAGLLSDTACRGGNRMGSHLGKSMHHDPFG